MKREIILKGTQTLGAFSLNDLFATVFGEENVEALKQQAQAAGTAYVLDATGKYVQANPDAVKAITSTGQKTVMDTLAEVWAQYKVPVVIAGVLAGGALAYGIYSMTQVNKLIKNNPKKKASARTAKKKKR